MNLFYIQKTHFRTRKAPCHLSVYPYRRISFRGNVRKGDNYPADQPKSLRPLAPDSIAPATSSFSSPLALALSYNFDSRRQIVPESSRMPTKPAPTSLHCQTSPERPVCGLDMSCARRPPPSLAAHLPSQTKGVNIIM